MNGLGEPREIVIDSHEWNQQEKKGRLYSYHMSSDRYERPIKKSYEVWIEAASEVTLGALVSKKLCTIGYYDFIDFNYEDCISERKVEALAHELGRNEEDIYVAVKETLEQLQQEVRKEFSYSEEYQAKKEHEKIIKAYQKAKREFAMQYGFMEVEYDRCYNVFGQLMDANYLNDLMERLEERQAQAKQSKRYRKEYYRSRFHDYFNASTASVAYSDQERNMLGKFYKLLAKKYHPDANPKIDTSAEMTLLNKLKKDWSI